MPVYEHGYAVITTAEWQELYAASVEGLQIVEPLTPTPLLAPMDDITLKGMGLTRDLSAAALYSGPDAVPSYSDALIAVGQEFTQVSADLTATCPNI